MDDPVATETQTSQRSWILVALLFSFLVVCSSTSSSGYLFPRAIPDILVIGLSGMIITLMGLGFSVCARVHLGKYWSSMPAIRVDHKLIRTGPYRFVRHPIYTGILVGIAGTASIMGEPLGLIVFLLILGVYLWKIQMEEKYLQEEFVDEYVWYKKEVTVLIPFLV